jgi:hypothetical protein
MAVALGIAAADALHVEREGFGLDIAQGHHNVAGKDEGDSGELRRAKIDGVGDDTSHDVRALLDVKTV